MAAKYALTTASGPATAEEAGGVGRPPESPRDVSATAASPATARTTTRVPAASTLPGHRQPLRGGAGSGRHSSGAVMLGTCPASARFRAGSLRNRWSRKSSGGGLFGEAPGPAESATPGSAARAPGPAATAAGPADGSGPGPGAEAPASADEPRSDRPAGSPRPAASPWPAGSRRPAGSAKPRTSAGGGGGPTARWGGGG